METAAPSPARNSTSTSTGTIRIPFRRTRRPSVNCRRVVQSAVLVALAIGIGIGSTGTAAVNSEDDPLATTIATTATPIDVVVDARPAGGILEQLWETLQKKINDAQDSKNKGSRRFHSPWQKNFKDLFATVGARATTANAKATSKPAIGRPMVATNRQALYEHSIRQTYVRAQQDRNLSIHNETTVSAWRDWIKVHLGYTSYSSSTSTTSNRRQLDDTQQQQQHDPTSTASTDRSRLLHAALPPYSHAQKHFNLDRIRHMFQHAYDSYMYHAWPASEIKPISCAPATFDLIRLQGLTVVDALDTLVVLGNYTEFARATERLRLQNSREPIVAVNQNVSVFETNIRVLGGLLSAHQMAEAYFVRPADTVPEPGAGGGGGSTTEPLPLQVRVPKSHVWDAQGNILIGKDAAGTTTCPVVKDHDVCDSALRSLPDCVVSTTSGSDNKKKKGSNATLSANDYWQYDGFLLELAQDLGYRLLPAFDTKTGIPYGTVNLLYGVPAGETTIASLAGGGTLTLEFELLSRLTGDDSFGKAAKLASRALWVRRSALDLLGKHIDVQRGSWTEYLSGIGSNSDSYLEYLVKHYLLFPEDADFWTMLQSVYIGIQRHNRLGEWYRDIDMKHGHRPVTSRRVLESLMAFFPGMQVLLGELTPAARTLNSFFMVREFLGFLPERFHFGHWRLDAGLSGAAKHPLRPELLESCYFLHRATKDMKVDLNENTTQVSASSGWLWAADFALEKLESTTRAKCGYAGVTDLKPSTSGSVDGSTKGVHLMDDMPSFFLSETLKYLYLIFDDDNILHQDPDREWIFTTEAHPVHHVPKPKAVLRRKADEKKEPFLEEVESLKSLLSDKLAGNLTPRSRSSPDLNGEKWGDHTLRKTYQDNINTVIADMHLERSQQKLSQDQHCDFFGKDQPIEPIVRQEFVMLDTLNDTLHERNIAHLAMSNLGLGNGIQLRKACPNLYSSDLLWMHALNGGATDYSDVYLSATLDDASDLSNEFAILGAGEALGSHGSGLYLGQAEDQGCPVPATLQDGVTDSTPPPGEKISNSRKSPEGEVFDISSEFGKFEVSPFGEGGGFFIHHIDSGATIVASLLTDEDDTSKLFVMTDSIFPVPQIVMPEDGKDASADGEEWNEKKSFDTERTTVFADFEGNSFRCEVELLLKFQIPDDTEENKGTVARERVLGSYPCAPALFGPTNMSRLVETNGVSIEASVAAPVEGDECGCKKAPPSTASGEVCVPGALENQQDNVTTAAADSCTNESIQILVRGECAFQTKALNQKKEWNAAATIIINSEDEELFVMSVGDDTLAQEAPLSVLLSGLDGEHMLNTMTTVRQEDANAMLTARISVSRQVMSLVDATAAEYLEKIRWPIIRGGDKRLQIFAAVGWGLQAQQDETNNRWHINLFQHETPLK